MTNQNNDVTITLTEPEREFLELLVEDHLKTSQTEHRTTFYGEDQALVQTVIDRCIDVISKLSMPSVG